VKRGFLFGLGSFLTIAAIISLGSALIGTFGLAGIIVALICATLSAIVIRAAIAAPSHRSRLHTVIGWCLGFFVIDAVVFGIIGVAILVPFLAK
jgi:hypothetical protein